MSSLHRSGNGYISGERDVETGSSTASCNGNGDESNDTSPRKAGPKKTNNGASAARGNEVIAESAPATADEFSMASQARARIVILPRKTFLFCGLIVALGCAAAAAVVAVGLTGARNEQDKQFDRRSSEVMKYIISTWSAYEFLGLHTHNVCRKGVTRQEFRELYEYLNSTGLVFQSATWIPNVTHDERTVLEAEAKEFYAELYPEMKYRGFTGIEYSPDNPNGFAQGLRSAQPFYFPGHYVEPTLENLGQIDYDIFSGPKVVTRGSVELSLSTWKPSLTPRIRIARDRGSTELVYSIILLHPGVRLTTTPDHKPRDLAAIVIRIPDFLVDLSTKMVESAGVYLYDSTNPDKSPDFLGGASMLTVGGDGDVITESKAAIELSELLSSSSKSKIKTTVIDIAYRKWTVVIVAIDGAYQPNTVFVILGGAIIVFGCICLAAWLYTNTRRQSELHQIEAIAAAEKIDIIVENAKKSAKTERDLNDFIAHEVRNPLSAALSACSFVAAALDDAAKSLAVKEERRLVLDDVHIIDSSLHFINDLLRNILDMQRASSNQLIIEVAPTDLLRDVMLPVDAMLYRRNCSFEVQLVCPDNLIVSTDRLRLKQIVLNLGRNSLKFVEKGFVRLRAAEVKGNVHVYIEDSGPGIPKEKRGRIFTKFQESLDSLNQGTGIGLSLCMNLSELMGAEIWFDEAYDSGIAGCPGTRFVINLKKPCLRLEDEDLDKFYPGGSSPSLVQNVSRVDSSSTAVKQIESTQGAVEASVEPILPTSLSVLFVDDDMVLRKLFVRAVKKVAPGWSVQEAANGETALRKVDEDEHFDLIFMDQYMASVEKQLLGTEATRALRSKGVTCKICGLSANDKKEAFLEAGANAFMMKPFPCDKTRLTQELLRILQ